MSASIGRFLKIYIPFARSEVQRFLAYKVSFFLWMAYQILYVVVNYYLWVAIFNSSDTAVLRGFTLDEMIVYVIISFCITNVIGVGLISRIGNEIVDGSIALNLIRPIKYMVMVFFKVIGSNLPRICLILIPGFIWLLCISDTFNLKVLLMVIISIMMSFIINFLFEFCVAMIVFYTTYIFGINILKATIVRMLSGSLIPLTFFPEFIQRILEYLPFMYMVYMPVMLCTKGMLISQYFQLLIAQIIWVVLLYALAVFLWKRALKRLTILGG